MVLASNLAQESLISIDGACEYIPLGCTLRVKVKSFEIGFCYEWLGR